MGGFCFMVVEDVLHFLSHPGNVDNVVLIVRWVENGEAQVVDVDSVVLRKEKRIHVHLQRIVEVGRVADVVDGFDSVAVETVFAEFDTCFGVDKFFTSFPVENSDFAVVSADEVESSCHVEVLVVDCPFGADRLKRVVAGEVEEEMPFGGVVFDVFAVVVSFDAGVEHGAQLPAFLAFSPPFFDKAFGRNAHLGGFLCGDFFRFEVGEIVVDESSDGDEPLAVVGVSVVVFVERY